MRRAILQIGVKMNLHLFFYDDLCRYAIKYLLPGNGLTVALGQ
jgi:hypothetical protein